MASSAACECSADFGIGRFMDFDPPCMNERYKFSPVEFDQNKIRGLKKKGDPTLILQAELVFQNSDVIGLTNKPYVD